MKQYNKQRLQELAGIKPSSPEMEMNASYPVEGIDYSNVHPDYHMYPFKPEFKNGMTNIVGKGANGTSDSKPVILCSRTPFKFIDCVSDEEGNGVFISFMNVKFKKSLNEIFIDTDEYDIEEFGLEYDNKELNDLLDNNEVITLDQLLPFGLDVNNEGLTFYGCYVLNIKPNEIIEITKENEDGTL